MVEVILKKDIYKLGDRGEVVTVAAGYARNCLYPQQLAIPADKGSLKQLDAMKAAADREAVRLRGDAEKQLDALEGVVVRIVARASLNNQLYGSVTARDIAASLAGMGIEVNRHRIQLKTPFRTLGDFEVPVHIYKDLASTVKVEIRAEGREDEPLARSQQSAEQFEFAPAPVREEEAEEPAQASGEDASAGEAESPAEEEAASEEGAEAAAAASESESEPVPDPDTGSPVEPAASADVAEEPAESATVAD